MRLSDQVLVCRVCGDEFVFSAGERELIANEPRHEGAGQQRDDDRDENTRVIHRHLPALRTATGVIHR